MSRLLPAWGPSAAAIVATVALCLGIHGYRVANLASQDAAGRDAHSEAAAAECDGRMARLVRQDGRPPLERLGLGRRPAQALLVQRWRWRAPDSPDPRDSDRPPFAPTPLLCWMDQRTLTASYRQLDGNDATWIPLVRHGEDPRLGATDRLIVIPAALEAQAIAQEAERWRAWLTDSYARRAWQHQQAAIRFQCDAADAADRRRNAIIAMFAVLGVGVCAAWALWQEARGPKRSSTGW